MKRRSCSIVVDNFNYARYLPAAIDSALAQDYPDVEVIVVDDGSTDDSREVIESYADRVTAVLKENGGQGSALNAGAVRSSGDVVIFVDADDALYPDAVSTAMPLFADPNVTKVHWFLNVMEADGTILSERVPRHELSSGDLSADLLAHGPGPKATAPTSGNAWSRAFLERVLPIPEDAYRIQPDEYLDTLASALGRVEAVGRPLALKRRHPDTWSAKRTEVDAAGPGTHDSAAARALAWDAEQDRLRIPTLAAALARNGVEVDVDTWLRNSWWLRIERAVEAVTGAVPSGASFVLLDDNAWDVDGLFGDRLPVAASPLLADTGATEEWMLSLFAALEPFDYIAFGWQAFWWLDMYPTVATRLAEQFRLVAENDAVRVFERTSAPPG